MGAVICYDNQFPEVARVLALRRADVLLMPHAARFKPWADTTESEAAARRHSHDFLSKYALRARENACFAVLVDQAGWAGTLDCYPEDHENQPHHAGAAFIWGPDGNVLASAQQERVQEELIVADLDPPQTGPRAFACQLYAPHAPARAVRRAAAGSGLLLNRGHIWDRVALRRVRG